MRAVRNLSFIVFLATFVFALQVRGLQASGICSTWSSQGGYCESSWKETIFTDHCGYGWGNGCWEAEVECEEYCYFTYNMPGSMSGPCYNDESGYSSAQYCQCGWYYGGC